jgi:hypothetical protein
VRRSSAPGHQTRQHVEIVALHEAALVMARLRPRIGKEHEGARQRAGGQCRHHEARIVGEQPHVAHARAFDVG